ncbi:MAG: thioredoxin family protein [Planctomycetota bacterium]
MTRTVAPLLGALFLAVSPTFGQDLEAKLKEKLAHPWIQEQGWITDYDEAMAQAKESGKLIFGYFSRSYAPCPPCSALEHGVIETPEFAEFAQEVVPFLHITTRIEGRKHDDLLTQKGGKGFPHLVIMDAEGGVLKEVEDRSVESFRAAIEDAKAYQTLAAKADRTPAEDLQLLELDVALGRVKGDEALARLETLEGVDAGEAEALRAEIEHKAFDATVLGILEAAPQPTNEAEQKAAIKQIGEQFWAHHQEGKRPSDDMLKTPFFSLIMQYGINEGLAGAARAGYDGLFALHGDNPRAKAQFDTFREQVEAVEAKAGGAEQPEDGEGK